MNTTIRTLVTRTALAGAALTGAAALALGTAGAASAVSTSTPDYAQPPSGSILYTLSPNDSGSAATLLEDNNNGTGNGAVVDTWAPTIFDSNSGGQILQANEQWYFLPVAGNTGGTITTGMGELVNRQSGLCLDINESNWTEATSDNALVDQWQCVAGAPNEEWTAFQSPDGSGWEVASDLTGTYNGVYDDAVLGNDNPNCQPQDDNNGTPVVTHLTYSDCTVWNIQRVSYEFATSIVDVPGSIKETDSTTYTCNPGYNMRLNPGYGGGDYNYYSYKMLEGSSNMSSIANYQGWSDGDTPYTGVPAQPLYFHNDAPYWMDAQMAFYCDPGSYTNL
jgi:hypothetical protein